MSFTVKSRLFVTMMLMALLVVPFAFSAGSASASSPVGAVYTINNSAAGNAVLIFNREANGALSPAGSVATGGLGLGRGLGSQGAVTLSKSKRWLFVVNAGNNTISSLKVTSGGLTLADTVASGGVTPVSITVHENVVYVLNTGSDTINGFKVNKDGKLNAIPGSSRNLSQHGTSAAQVSFSPDGDFLVVTERATNRIDTFKVEHGVAGNAKVFPAAGITPFGFDFAGENKVIVSEAFGGAVNGSATSSYRLRENGNLEVISSSVPTHQTAACWVVVTENGKYAYAANAGSSSVSGYSVARNGSITLLNPDGRTGSTGTGANPVDAALSHNSQYLYVLTSNVGRISGFQIQGNGQLVALDGIGGFPVGAAGIAAR